MEEVTHLLCCYVSGEGAPTIIGVRGVTMRRLRGWEIDWWGGSGLSYRYV